MHAIAPTDHRADEHVDTNPSRPGTPAFAQRELRPHASDTRTQLPDGKQLPHKAGKFRSAINQAACSNCRARKTKVMATSHQASDHPRLQLINTVAV